MSENLDKSNINEAGKSKSSDSEQGLEDAVEWVGLKYMGKCRGYKLLSIIIILMAL